MDRVVLLSAESSRRVPLAPSLLLQYWLAVSMQPGSYHLQVPVLSACWHLYGLHGCRLLLAGKIQECSNRSCRH